MMELLKSSSPEFINNPIFGYQKMYFYSTEEVSSGRTYKRYNPLI